VACNPVGQVVGSMKQIRLAKEVLSELIDGFYDATDRLNQLLPDEEA